MAKYMTPLRWLIAIAYLVAGAASYFYWHEIGTFFDFFLGNSIRFLKAAGGVLFAILTLQLGVAFTAIFSALLIVLKVAIGILVTALMPGTLKAIILPLVFDFISFVHGKSLLLQRFVAWLLSWSKGQYVNTKAWWAAQHVIDKSLLYTLGFLTVPVLGLVFFYKRFILPFLVTKLGENFVQRAVKLVWAYLKRTVLMGSVFYTARKAFVLSKRWIRRKNRRLSQFR